MRPKSPEPEQPQSLVDLALAGDARAMRALTDVVVPPIRRRVSRVLRRSSWRGRGRDFSQELEDLVQEVFLALLSKGWRPLMAWDRSRGLSFSRFVELLAERELGMMMRTMKRNPWTEDPTEDSALDLLQPFAESHERLIQAREILNLLVARSSPRARLYFVSVYLEQRLVAEVAYETGSTPAAIYAWRSRLGKMARELACG